MCGRTQHLHTGVGDPGRDVLRVVWWGGRVVRAREQERRCGDAGEVRTKVHVGYRLTALRIALRIGAGQHRLQPRGQVGVPTGQLGGDPRAARHAGDGRRALGADRGGAVAPALSGWQPRGRAHQDETGDPLGVVGGQMHRGHAAERDSGDVGPLDVELVQDAEDIGGESAQAAAGSDRLAGDVPCRRVSMRMTRSSSASGPTHADHMSPVVPMEFSSTSAGADAGPSSVQPSRIMPAGRRDGGLQGLLRGRVRARRARR